LWVAFFAFLLHAQDEHVTFIHAQDAYGTEDACGIEDAYGTKDEYGMEDEYGM